MDNLIFQTAFLGDLFLAIPLMREWRRREPEHRLVLVCRKGLGAYFSEQGIVDEVIEVTKKDPGAWKKQQRELLQREFNNVICPHPSFRSAWLVSQLNVRGVRVGFARWWNVKMFDRRVVRPDHLPDALRQLSLLAALDSDFAEEFSYFSSEPEVASGAWSGELIDYRGLEIPQWARLDGEGGERAPSRKVFIAPGSVWATKRWVAEGYEEVARRLVGRGYDVHFVGGPEERELCEQIKARVEGVENHAGEWSIPQTVAQMREALVLIANDSGAIHMAAAAGLPTVSIFGPTTPDLGFRPWQSNALVVQKNLPCRPCGPHGHHKCPIGTHDCMKLISPDQVLSAVNRLIS